MRQKIASITQRFCLPVVCVLCHHYHDNHVAVCTKCQALLVRIKFKCSKCSLPLAGPESLLCGQCIKQKPAFDKVHTVYRFEEPLRTLLHEFKYQKALYLRTFMVKLMLDALPFQSYQLGCLVPVPMHSTRLRQRGFNQAAELAKLLAKHLQIPVDLTLCTKTINTVPQASLNSKQRRHNLRNAFLAKAHSYQHITLIDDLMTTGSTVNELANALKRQGSARVDVWCLART